MKRSNYPGHSYGAHLSATSKERDLTETDAAVSNCTRKVEEDDGRQCPNCGSWTVKSLGVIHATSSTNLAALSPYGMAPPDLATWVARAYPPEKMTTWTGFTLSLLLWPPCIFLLGISLYGWFTGSLGKDSALLYLSAGAFGIGAWSLPGLLRKRTADQHNVNV